MRKFANDCGTTLYFDDTSGECMVFYEQGTLINMIHFNTLFDLQTFLSDIQAGVTYIASGKGVDSVAKS